MRTHGRLFLALLILAMILPSGLLLSSSSQSIAGQSLPRLFDGSFAPRADGPHARRLSIRSRRAMARLQSLDAPALSLNLFENTEVVARRARVERPRADRLIWHGVGDDGSQTVFAVVKGALSGTIYRHGQTFDVVPDGNGLYRISELDAAAFPTDDPPLDTPEPDLSSGTPSGAQAPATAGDTGTQIDVLVLWTPAARNAAGGTAAAIESLVQSAVANANLAYTNSLVNAQLRLVHAEEVSFTEATASISTDLTSLQKSGDGKLDVAQTLRDQYGADVVTLIGSGYVANGACGIGYLMGTPSTSFASMAYNVVDQSCAAGYLSYAHEVGHNEGLHHDPANASGTPSFPYAYGYQDPGGLFRTVMSYGSATRVPYFSSPTLFYGGTPMGTSSQNNASALSQTAPVVAQFRPAADGSVSGGSTPPPPPCSYSVSPGSLSFSTSGGAANVTVTTSSGCSWSSTSGTSWVSAVGTGNASGASKVTVQQNAGGNRTSSVTVAGIKVSVSQQGVKVSKRKGR